MITLEYFNNIKQEAREYFLGLMASDGNVFVHKNKRSEDRYTINYNCTDKEIMDFISSTFKVKYSEGKIKKSTHKQPYRLRFTIDKNLFDYLYLIGITPRKSLTLSINESTLLDSKHFLRGVFDGDGSFYWKKGKGANIEIVTSSENFKNQCEYMLSKYLDKYTTYMGNLDTVKIRVDKRMDSGKTSWKIQLTRKLSIINFYMEVYEGAHYFLTRKKEKIEEYIYIT